MPTYWSANPIVIERPGGIFWRRVMHAWLNAVLPGPPAALFNAAQSDIGVLSASEKPLAASLSGGQTTAGTEDSALKQLSASFNGRVDAGSVNVSLPKIQPSLVGGQMQTAALAVALQQLSAQLQVTEEPQGVLAATLNLATVAISVGQIQSGSFIAALQKVSAQFAGGQTETGTLAASLMKALASLAGTDIISGVTPDATGAGGIDENTGSVYSFNTNATAGSTLFVFANTADNFGHQPVNSVIYDPTGANVTMNLLTHVYPNNDSGKGDCYCYFLQNIPGSNKSVQVTLNAASWSVANSVSYNNVQKISLLASQYSGTATAPSVSASPALAGDVVVNAYQGQNGPITPSGGTLRSNIATTTASSNAGLSIQDTTTSTTFSGTSGASFPTWASITINLSAVPRAKPTIVGVASVAGTSITIPAHVAGNRIYLWVFRDGSNSLPTKPTATAPVPNWVIDDGPTGANSCSAYCVHFDAVASTTTSGTWTGATGIVAVVVSGQDVNMGGGHAQSGAASTNTVAAPAMSMTITDGSSLVLEFYGHRSVTAWSAAPAGYTRQTSVATEVCCNTKDDTTSDGAVSQPCTAASGGSRGQVVEVVGN